MPTKDFKTYDEQINILVSRGIQIVTPDDKSFAKKTLQEIYALYKFYSLMLQQKRQAIAKTFHMGDSELENVLFYVSSARNFCAHGNRIYCFRNKRPLSDMRHHNALGIPLLPNGEYSYGKRDLFALLIALKATLSKTEFRRMVKVLGGEMKIVY